MTPTMRTQWPLQMKLVATSIILLKKLQIAKEAIKAAMAITSQELDAVIIAGKGADCYQIVQGKKEVVEDAKGAVEGLKKRF